MECAKRWKYITLRFLLIVQYRRLGEGSIGRGVDWRQQRTRERHDTQTTADFISQLTRRLCLSLERKGVVTRELIEGDRLASCEPLHVIRQQTRFPLAVATLQVDQSIGGPFRHATGQDGFLEFGGGHVHIVDLAPSNSRNFLRRSEERRVGKECSLTWAHED